MKTRIVAVLLILVCSTLIVSNVLATPTCPDGGLVCEYGHRADGLYVTISQSGTTTVWNERARNISSHGLTIVPNGSIDFRAISIDQECSAMNNRIGMRYIPEETGAIEFFLFDIQAMCAYFKVPWGNSSNIQSVPQTIEGSTYPLLDCQIETDGANIRSGPGMNYDVIGWVTTGTRAVALSIDNGWYYVSYGGQQVGYVSNTVANVNGCLNLKDITSVNQGDGITVVRYGVYCTMLFPKEGTVTIDVLYGSVVYNTVNQSVSLLIADISNEGNAYNAVWTGGQMQGIIWSDCSTSSFISPTPIPTVNPSVGQTVANPKISPNVLYGTLTSGDCFILLPGWGAIYNYNTEDNMQRLTTDDYIFPIPHGNGLVSLYLSYHSNGYNWTQDVVVNTDNCSRLPAPDPVPN